MTSGASERSRDPYADGESDRMSENRSSFRHGVGHHKRPVVASMVAGIVGVGKLAGTDRIVADGTAVVEAHRCPSTEHSRSLDHQKILDDLHQRKEQQQRHQH